MRTSKLSMISRIVSLLTVVIASTIQVGICSSSSDAIASTGVISYWPQADLTININTHKVLGTNNMSVGFMLDWHRWLHFTDSPVQRQLARDANFRLIRVFDFRKISPYGYPDLIPCTYWNEQTRTGTWDWTQVNKLTSAIFDINAEPLFCLGWARDNIKNYIPNGMAVNPDTSLPYPESYAAYAKEWVKHFKTLDLPVRYYQISNEPYFYFGWDKSDTTKLANYIELWNTVARAMRAENPNILLSHDGIMIKWVLDYWIEHGDDIDYLDFHKYDAETAGQYTDERMFELAEQRFFKNYGSYYGVDVARQRWFSERGRWLPVICSESNFSYAWEDGTDPKIQQMSGAVWLALVLRMGILKGLTCSVYFEFSSSKSWQESHGTGWGFGMINEDNNQPWYPYYVHEMIGSNLAVGDELVEAESSSNDIRSIAWVNDGKLNILLICKVDEQRTVTIKGLNGQLDVSWIDNAIPYEAPSMQTSIISSVEPLTMSGYTVALLEMPTFS